MWESGRVTHLVCCVKSAEPEPVPFRRVTNFRSPLAPRPLPNATKGRWRGLLDRSLHGSHHGGRSEGSVARTMNLQLRREYNPSRQCRQRSCSGHCIRDTAVQRLWTLLCCVCTSAKRDHGSTCSSLSGSPHDHAWSHGESDSRVTRVRMHAYSCTTTADVTQTVAVDVANAWTRCNMQMTQ